MADTVSEWRGRPLSELSKEELIKIIDEMGRMLLEERGEHQRQVKFMAALRGAR